MYKHLKIQIGDLVDIKTAVYLKKGKQGSLNVAEKFMVTEKNIDFQNGIISWTFIEANDKN